MEPPGETRELTVDEAVALAIQLQKNGQLDEAEGLYARILELFPDHPDALHFSGVLAQQQGRSAEAIALIGKSLAIAPERADPWPASSFERRNHERLWRRFMTHRSAGAIGAALVVGWLAAAQAQTPGSGSRDIMPELLAEVRGLRAAIEQMTASSSRVQLALGRLQLQEQRLSAASGRLADVRNELGNAQRRAAELQEQASHLESLVSGQREMPKPEGQTSAEQIRRQITAELQAAQHGLTAANAEVQRLTVQENTLASEVSAEEARWADLNRQLEDLERSLRPVK
jgi:tetratricopeptide (TPR) repeat protein